MLQSSGKLFEQRPLLLALWQILFYKVMKGFGVVHVDHVGEFVDDNVVYALFGGLHKMDVEGDDTVASTVAPLAFHTSEFHLFW